MQFQFSSVTQWCLILCDPMDCSMPGFHITNSQSLVKLMSIELVMPSNYLILCHPLFLLPSIFPSITVFSNESVLHIRRLKYWNFSSVSVLPMNIPMKIYMYVYVFYIFLFVYIHMYKCISVQFSHSVISDSVVSGSLQPHGLQYVRLPCPSPSPGAWSNSCPLSW